ncbi:MAG: GldG family protein [Deltaproteobacteria bacterium]|nr:GldG family protein [Deltaproteobacteria bacterium]
MAGLGSFYGIVGTILLLFAGVAYFLTRLLSLYVIIHLVLGVLAVATYLASARGSLGTFLGERSTKQGAQALLYSVLFFLALVMVNYLSTRNHHRFDLTEEGVFSLSPQTRNLLQKLDKPLEINAFVEVGSDPALRELLNGYREVSSHVSFRLIDPDKQPDLAEKFQITAIPAVHMQYGERTNVINKVSEEEVTNGVIKITRAEKKIVYFLGGHGEPDINDLREPRGYGQLKTALENESYETKPIILSADAAVPDDANLLVVGGGDRALQAHEITAIDAHIKKGKHALFLLNPRGTSELVTYLAQWGIQVGDDVIVDEQLQLLKGRTFTLTPFVTSYGAHPITEELSRRSNALTTYGMSRSVEANAEGKAGVTVVNLAQTGPNAWAETDLESIFQRQTARLDDIDRKGPVSLAVAATANLKEMGVEKEKESTARLVVFGDSTFANNQYVGQYFNRDLILNSIGWLIGEEGLMSIRARTIRASRVQFSAEQGTAIFYLSVLVLPEVLLIAGLAVWWRRAS